MSATFVSIKQPQKVLTVPLKEDPNNTGHTGRFQENSSPETDNKSTLFSQGTQSTKINNNRQEDELG